MKYRPISHPVDAYQYTGHNAEELGEIFLIWEERGMTLVRSKGDELALDPGDWLVMDETRTTTVVPDCYFKLRYEPAE